MIWKKGCAVCGLSGVWLMGGSCKEKKDIMVYGAVSFVPWFLFYLYTLLLLLVQIILFHFYQSTHALLIL